MQVSIITRVPYTNYLLARSLHRKLAAKNIRLLLNLIIMKQVEGISCLMKWTLKVKVSRILCILYNPKCTIDYVQKFRY